MVLNDYQKAEFLKQAMIPNGVSLEIDDHEKFYKERKVILMERILELLG